MNAALATVLSIMCIYGSGYFTFAYINVSGSSINKKIFAMFAVITIVSGVALFFEAVGLGGS